MNISKQFISGLPQIPFRFGVGQFEGVVGHSTDDKEATAQNIHDWEARTFQNAFVHFAVDWNGVIQIASTDFICFGCGHTGNQRFVQIELCETDDPAKFKTSYGLYIQLIAELLKSKNFDLSNFYTHDDIRKMFPQDTTHTDPVEYLNGHGVSIAKLRNDIQWLLDEYNGKHSVLTSTQTKMVVVDVDGLNIRNAPNFDDSSVIGQVKKGEAFTIAKELNGFYQLKSGAYITSSTKYVHTVVK
jgi:N-acetylmuramoyl-L-alanine amidase